MKKLLFLLIVLPFMLVSCDDDEEMPNVDFKVEISGGKFIDKTIYVVKGDTLWIENVEIISHDKNAAMGAVSYFWDGRFILTNPYVPYKIFFPTAGMVLSEHRLHFNCQVYVEDYPIMTAYFDYRVKLVESPDSIPNKPTQPIVSGYSVVRD